MANERRLAAYAEYQKEKASLQNDLNKIHAQALGRQMDSAQKRRYEDQVYKIGEKKVMDKKGELDQFGYRIAKGLN